jgi:hypothetical protein
LRELDTALGAGLESDVGFLFFDLSGDDILGRSVFAEGSLVVVVNSLDYDSSIQDNPDNAATYVSSHAYLDEDRVRFRLPEEVGKLIGIYDKNEQSRFVPRYMKCF